MEPLNVIDGPFDRGNLFFREALARGREFPLRHCQVVETNAIESLCVRAQRSIAAFADRSDNLESDAGDVGA
jgi:hypothetical protein